MTKEQLKKCITVRNILNAGLIVSCRFPDIYWDLDLTLSELKILRFIYNSCMRVYMTTGLMLSKKGEEAPRYVSTKYKMAQKCKVSETTFRNAIRKLHKLGLISSMEDRDDFWSTNSVTLSTTYLLEHISFLLDNHELESLNTLSDLGSVLYDVDTLPNDYEIDVEILESEFLSGEIEKEYVSVALDYDDDNGIYVANNAPESKISKQNSKDNNYITEEVKINSESNESKSEQVHRISKEPLEISERTKKNGDKILQKTYEIMANSQYTLGAIDFADWKLVDEMKKQKKTNTEKPIYKANTKKVNINKVKKKKTELDNISMSDYEKDVLNTVVKRYNYRMRKLLNKDDFKMLANNFKGNTPKQKAKWTSFTKIYDLCKKNNWDIDSYIDIQFKRAKKWTRGYPEPNQCYSEKAVSYYNWFLKDYKERMSVTGKIEYKAESTKTLKQEIIEELANDCTYIKRQINLKKKRPAYKNMSDEEIKLYILNDIDNLEKISPYYWAQIPWIFDYLNTLPKYKFIDKVSEDINSVIKSSKKYELSKNIAKLVEQQLELPSTLGTSHTKCGSF